MGKSERDVDALEERVKSRKSHCLEVIGFVREATRKFGTMTREEEHSGHTRIDRELIDFHGFSFYVESGLTMHGGNTVRVVYGDQTVFSIYYQSIDDPEVRTYVDEKRWRCLLDGLAENRNQVYEQHQGVLSEAEKARETERENEMRYAGLETQAKRLGLA